MKRIGLTGGIGSGKSTVAKLFHDLGKIPVVDADEIARKLRAPGGLAEAPLLKRFNTTDPSSLRSLLVNDPVAKKDLEAILHPLIQKESETILSNAAQSNPDAPFLLYEASLLIESGRTSDFDQIWVVIAPQPERIARIMHRDQTSQNSALQIIQSQTPDTYRIQHADRIINNAGSIEDLRREILKVLEQMKSA